MATFSVLYDWIVVEIRVTGLTGLTLESSLRFLVTRTSTGETVSDATYNAEEGEINTLHEVYPLDPSTSYTVNVCFDGTWLGARTFTTLPSPECTVLSVTEASVTVSVSNLAAGIEYDWWVSEPDASKLIKSGTWTAASDSVEETFTGLVLGAEHTIGVSVSADSSSLGARGFASITVIVRPPEFAIASVTATSVTASLTNLTVGVTYEARVTLGRIKKATTTFTATEATKTVVLAGLSGSTTYNFYLYQNEEKVGTVSFKTLAAAAPRIGITNITQTGVTVGLFGLAAGTDYAVSIESQGAFIDEAYFTATSSTYTKAFGGLSPGVSYTVRLQDADTLVYVDSVMFTTLYARPPDWAWPGTIQDTVPVDGLIGLTAADWTAFCARINEFCAYTGDAQRDFTPVTAGMPISAAIINAAISAISQLPGHGALPAVASAGMDFTPSILFDQLKNALNAVP